MDLLRAARQFDCAEVDQRALGRHEGEPAAQRSVVDHGARARAVHRVHDALDLAAVEQQSALQGEDRGLRALRRGQARPLPARAGGTPTVSASPARSRMSPSTAMAPAPASSASRSSA